MGLACLVVGKGSCADTHSQVDPGQVETEFSVVRFGGDREKAAKVYEGVEPLTPEDVAEVVIFMAGRRENVVVADVLLFPNHQVSLA